MQKLPIVFLAFSNDGGNYLDNLNQERNRLKTLFDQAQSAELCTYIIEANASPEDIFRVMNDLANRDRIVVFHYAGHADSRGIWAENADGSTQLAYIEGLAKLLGTQKQLQLVMLNGCSTAAQVAALQKNNIPNIIATARPIEDDLAATFAAAFYQKLLQRGSIAESYANAESMVLTQHSEAGVRGMSWQGKGSGNHLATMPWQSFFAKPDWRLSSFQPIGEGIKIFLLYAPEDEDDKRELEKHIKIMVRNKLIDTFDVAQLAYGGESEATIKQKFAEARIILPLITPSFFSDDRAYDYLNAAMDRQDIKDAVVIPIYIENVDIQGERFTKLRPLPSNGKFVNKWADKAEAFYDISKGIRSVVMSVKS